MAEQGRCQPADVLNIVGFVKDQHGIPDLNRHGPSDDWIDEVVVGAEDQLGLSCAILAHTCAWKVYGKQLY